MRSSIFGTPRLLVQPDDGHGAIDSSGISAEVTGPRSSMRASTPFRKRVFTSSHSRTFG